VTGLVCQTLALEYFLPVISARLRSTHRRREIIFLFLTLIGYGDSRIAMNDSDTLDLLGISRRCINALKHQVSLYRGQGYARKAVSVHDVYASPWFSLALLQRMSLNWVPPYSPGHGVYNRQPPDGERRPTRRRADFVR
jgi:hypothetical protein